MTDVLKELERRRTAARAGGGEKRVAAQHSKGKLTARERIEVLLDEGLVRGVRHVRCPPRHRFWHGGRALSGRRGGDGLGHDQRAPGLCLQPGFHGLGRVGLGNPWCEDLQNHGHGASKRRSGDWAQRLGRCTDPRGREFARGVWRGLSKEHRGLRRDPPDLCDYGALRGRRRLFTRDDRFHLHGEGLVLHVRHRARCGEDRDERGGDSRGAWRGHHAYAEVIRRGRRFRERHRSPLGDSATRRLPAPLEPGRGSGPPIL